MSEGSPVRGVVVGHGRLAQGLVDAVRKITAVPEDALVAVSNEGKSPDALADEIGEIVSAGPCIVFTDMQAGSCAFAARRLCHGSYDRAVLTGANLPMLLDFAVHRDLPLRELVARLEEHGRQGITAYNVDRSTNADRSVSGR